MPELSIEFHSTVILKKIAESLGTLIRIDLHVVEQNKMRFARIQILVDLAKQRKEVIWDGAFKQELIYDETPFFCVDCNSIDHLEGKCPSTPMVLEKKHKDDDKEKDDEENLKKHQQG